MNYTANGIQRQLVRYTTMLENISVPSIEIAQRSQKLTELFSRLETVCTECLYFLQNIIHDILNKYPGCGEKVNNERIHLSMMNV